MFLLAPRLSRLSRLHVSAPLLAASFFVSGELSFGSPLVRASLRHAESASSFVLCLFMVKLSHLTIILFYLVSFTIYILHSYEYSSVYPYLVFRHCGHWPLYLHIAMKYDFPSNVHHHYLLRDIPTRGETFMEPVDIAWVDSKR